jgi:hypothetical protein
VLNDVAREDDVERSQIRWQIWQLFNIALDDIREQLLFSPFADRRTVKISPDA